MTRQPGKKGFCEDTAYDGATGRALARLAVPVGWSVVGRLERADSFERPISVRLRAEGPDGSSVTSIPVSVTAAWAPGLRA